MLFPYDVQQVLGAYRQGLFPTLNPAGEFILYKPEARALLPASGMHVSKTLRRTLSQRVFEVRVNHDFGTVIRSCVRDQENWITPELIRIYTRLHELGWAHSVETYQDGALAGGLYGLAIGSCFFVESMFSLKSDASKVATYALVEELSRQGFELIDLQLISEHLQSLGAFEMEDVTFQRELRQALQKRTEWGRDESEVSRTMPGAIETRRLLLRGFRREDLFSYSQWCASEEVSRFALLDPPNDELGLERYLARAQTSYVEGLPDPWAVCLKESPGKVVGTVSCFRPAPGNPTLEVSYELSPEFWGQGLASEAVRAVMDWAFQSFPIHRLQARVAVENERSSQLLRRLGFTEEGVLRSVLWHERPWDLKYFSVLFPEWEKSRH